LNTLRLANSAGPGPSEAELSVKLPAPPISNPRCDDFMSFVRHNEQSPAVRDFLCHTLDSYKSVFSLGQADLALEELIKVIDLITGAYITDRYQDMISGMRARKATAEDCCYNLNAIFEIYTDVIHSPRQQLGDENKYLPKN
ncbi:MAG: hypothetical protein K2J15_03090, partial [Muribaculaceae bacterium]|nr:hypothetical protein [Muribaculaceae bacterium]